MVVKTKILVIEDDTIIARNIVTLLTEVGYSVDFSNNGKEGVEKALNNYPDLILCDIMMPIVDGFDVKRKLNESDFTFDIPFVFLTAKTEISDFRKGMELEADDYIFKPYKADELLNIIKNRIEKRKRTLTRIKTVRYNSDSIEPKNKFVSVVVGNISRNVNVNSILYIVASNQYSEIVLKSNKQFLVRKSLTNWEQTLPIKDFVRIHRKVIVNVNEIEKVFKLDGDYKIKLLNNNKEFKVSRRAMTALREKIESHIR